MSSDRRDDRADGRAKLPSLGAPEVPGELPTLDDFREIKRERYRRKLAAEHTKALAAAVFAAFDDPARPVLAGKGVTVADDGTVCSAAEDEDWCEIVAGLYAVHGAKLCLPCDTKVDPTTGAVRVVPHSHDTREVEGGGTDGHVPAGHANG